MDVRRVRPNEWRALRDLRLRALFDAPDAFETRYEEARQRPDERWIDWAAGSSDGQGQAIFVAWDGGRPVGIGFARRGKNTELLLEVRYDNEQARRLYERCGFVDTGAGVAEREMLRRLE